MISALSYGLMYARAPCRGSNYESFRGDVYINHVFGIALPDPLCIPSRGDFVLFLSDVYVFLDMKRILDAIQSLRTVH